MASAPSEFEAEIVDAAEGAGDPSTIVVQVWGELDVQTAPVLADVLQKVSAPSVRVIVEMSTVTFFDSSGVGTLMRAADRLRADGGALAVRNPTTMARRMMKILGLEGALPIEEEG